MISERERRQVAARMHLGVGQAEREYILLCALDTLSYADETTLAFCLKGGTALRQLYFADWRHSEDLDFTVLPALPAERLEPALVSWLAQMGKRHGLAATLVDIHVPNGAARARARVAGPLRHPQRLLLDFTLDEPVLLPPLRRTVVTGLFHELQPQVLCYTLEEILAEKLRAILQRGKARDYYDVWRLLGEKRNHLDVDLARRLLIAKCEHRQLPKATLGQLLDPSRLAQAALFWQRDIREQVPSEELPAWEAVVADLGRSLASVVPRE